MPAQFRLLVARDNRLYAVAYQLQPKNPVFGGKRHMLELRRTEKKWIDKPTVAVVV